MKFLEVFKSIDINDDMLLDLAFETGLIQRKRLITPSDLLFSICSESTNGTVSYNDIASQIEANDGVSVCRQAIWKKVTEPCVVFFKRILELIILNKMNKQENCVFRSSAQFKRILVQDSTIIRLPVRLFEIFSGVANANSKVCNARIQGVYDLIEERFISFSIDPYSKNDLEAAPELSLQKDDLVLRDRGYLISDEIQRHINFEAHCIYRYKNRTSLLDPTTLKPIDLLDKLDNETILDTEVMLTNKDKTCVRLVAIPVNKEIANIRRMKAKKEKKSPPSEEYLRLLSWSIFITTIPKEQADLTMLMKMYSLRWRIEVIFKCWKSNMGFAKIHNVSQRQLFVLLFARFIMILLYSQLIFRPCRVIIQKLLQKDLSLIKVTHYLSRNPLKLIEITRELNTFSGKIEKTIKSLAKYCSYDKRKRLNFEQEMDKLFTLS